MQNPIQIRVLHPIFVAGEPCKVGDVVDIEAVDADNVIFNGRAELVRPDDIVKVKAALEARARSLNKGRSDWMHR